LLDDPPEELVAPLLPELAAPPLLDEAALELPLALPLEVPFEVPPEEDVLPELSDDEPD
jgi:hypothetical protein